MPLPILGPRALRWLKRLKDSLTGKEAWFGLGWFGFHVDPFQVKDLFLGLEK